jgi:hypothetical protein
VASLILLIVIPLTSHHTETNTTYTYKNETTLQNVTIPNRSMEDVSNLNSSQYTSQVQVPGVFESSFTTKIDLATTLGPNVQLGIERTPHA